MSATVPVKMDEMEDRTVVESMLRCRLLDIYEPENGNYFTGTVISDQRTRVYFYKDSKYLGMDEDRGSLTQKMLQNFYEAEKAKLTAHSFGLAYEEQIDPDTGMVKSATVDDPNELLAQGIM
jgi:hypothetical protein